MTNAELADTLNGELGLSESTAVTVNVIRQWVRWGVLEKSQAAGRDVGLGPEWRRSERTLRRARRLTELRRGGVRRESAYVAHAYIEWGVGDFERARSAIEKEFAHARAQLMRRVSSETSFSSFAALSATRKRALSHQAGKLHERWVGSQFEQSPELYVTVLNGMRSGRMNTERLSSLIDGAAKRIAPSVAYAIDGQMKSALISGLAGLFGSSDEIQDSGEDAIKRATERDYRIARLKTRKQLRVMQRVGGNSDKPENSAGNRELLSEVAAVGPEITNGNWLISCFVACLNSQWRTTLSTLQERG